jgi:hypothetical protein
MDISLADVTLHIDQSLDPGQRARLESDLRAIAGVVSVHHPDDRPHLAIVQYNPQETGSGDLLKAVTGLGVRAELVGL